jgi:hypothetical protein
VPTALLMLALAWTTPEDRSVLEASEAVGCGL